MNFDLIAQHITPDFVIDVGANVGDWYSQAKAVWPNASYALIEGNPECEPMLLGLQVAYIIRLLSDKEQDVTFYTRKDAPTCTGASYYREQTEFYEGDKAAPNRIRTTTLDKLVCQDDLRLSAKTVLLKIDTQGSELDIMLGGQATLDATKGLIVEVAHVEYNRGAPTDAEVALFCNARGFRLIGSVETIVHPIHRNHIQSSLFYMRP